MIVTMLKAKIHRATVTQTDLEYEGSVSVDPELIEAAGLLHNEQIDVLNITNGERFTTYVIPGERGSGIIGINGAAAHKAAVGDLVILCAYIQMAEESAKQYVPTIVLVGEQNEIKEVRSTSHTGKLAVVA